MDELLEVTGDLVHQVLLDQLALARVEQSLAVLDLVGQKRHQLVRRARLPVKGDRDHMPTVDWIEDGGVAVEAHAVLEVLEPRGNVALQALPRLIVRIGRLQRLFDATREAGGWIRRPSGGDLQSGYGGDKQPIRREALEYRNRKRAALVLFDQAPLEPDLAVLAAADAICTGPTNLVKPCSLVFERQDAPGNGFELAPDVFDGRPDAGTQPVAATTLLACRAAGALRKIGPFGKRGLHVFELPLAGAYSTERLELIPRARPESSRCHAVLRDGFGDCVQLRPIS